MNGNRHPPAPVLVSELALLKSRVWALEPWVAVWVPDRENTADATAGLSSGRKRTDSQVFTAPTAETSLDVQQFSYFL